MVKIEITKDIGGSELTTTGWDIIRRAGTPPI
jgi:hypothetical protein